MTGVDIRITNAEVQTVYRFRMLARVTCLSQSDYLRRLVELHRTMLKSEDPRVQKMIYDLGLNKALID